MPSNFDASFVFLQNQDGTVLISVAAQIYDTGRTAAIEVSTTASESIFDIPSKAEPIARNYIPKYQPGTSFVSPNSFPHVPHGASRTLTAKEWERFKKKESSLYIVGAVRYGDLFNTGVPYETDYCYQISPTGLPFSLCPWDRDFHNTLK
jgi:hypothetical protein